MTTTEAKPDSMTPTFDELLAEFKAGKWDEQVAAEAAEREPAAVSPSDGE